MAEKPSVKDKNDSSKISDRLNDFLANLRKRVQNDDDNRIGWKRKLVTSNNQRLGVKRITNRPYRGAPNIPLPEADKLIMKQKPNFVLSVLTPKKKAFLRLEEGIANPRQYDEQIKRAEMGLNHVLNNKISLIDIIPAAVDNFLEKGHCIFKVYEKYEKKIVRKVIDLDKIPPEAVKQLKKAPKDMKIQFVADRFGLNTDDEEDMEIINDVIQQFNSGKTVIEFDLPVVESYPDIVVRPPEKVTPPSYALEIEKVERLNDEFYFTKRELIELSEDGVYDKKIVKDLFDLELTGKGKSSSEDGFMDSNKEQNEGVIGESEDELYRVNEVSCWYQPEDGKKYEKWVFTFLADVGDVESSLLRKIRYPYEISTWNYVKHDNEFKDPRWHSSRGEPEKIRALQEFMEKGISNLLTRDIINNTPTYTVLSNSNIQSNSIRFIPGQKIKVKSHGEIARLDDINKVDASSERIVQLLKAYAEEYLGSTDQLFKNATNKGGGKTLGEVQLGVQIQSAPNVLKVMRWLKTIKKLYTMVFELLKERVGESMYIDGMEITREDFNIPAAVIPNGSLDLAEQALRVQKAIGRLQFTLTAPPDMVTAEDRYNAAKDWLEADGVMDPDRYVTDPQEVMKQMKQQAQAEDQVLQQQASGLDQEISALKQAGAQMQGGEGGPKQA